MMTVNIYICRGVDGYSKIRVRFVFEDVFSYSNNYPRNITGYLNGYSL